MVAAPASSSPGARRRLPGGGMRSVMRHRGVPISCRCTGKTRGCLQPGSVDQEHLRCAHVPSRGARSGQRRLRRSRRATRRTQRSSACRLTLHAPWGGPETTLALREGMCGETPYEGFGSPSFLFSVLHGHCRAHTTCHIRLTTSQTLKNERCLGTWAMCARRFGHERRLPTCVTLSQLRESMASYGAPRLWATTASRGLQMPWHRGAPRDPLGWCAGKRRAAPLDARPPCPP
jgi:hypothetical protein